MKKLIFLVGLSVILFSCNSESSTDDVNNEREFKIEDKSYNVELTYDSTLFLNDVNYEDFFNCEVYFSDDEKSVWKLHVYDAIGSMHGYKLYDEKECSRYKGARFYVEMTPQGTRMKHGQKEQMNRIEGLMLLNPDKYLKRKLVKLNPQDDIRETIYNASAGDSIVLESGVYKGETGIVIASDYVTLTGKPGCFIYANCNVLDIGAHHVKVKNLFLTYLEPFSDECSDAVVLINSFSCSNVTIENCDISGYDGAGIYLHGHEKVSYFFLNNYIYNNPKGAFEGFSGDINDSEGFVFENNKIWNNGSDKINEPFQFKNIFTFGLDDSLQKTIDGFCPDASVYHFSKVEDKPLPFYGFDSTQIIGYINPADFSKGKTKGILIYERLKPIKFYEKLPKQLCDSSATKNNYRMMVICSDPETDREYNENGGEDWAWFVEEVASYYANQGVTIKHVSDLDDATFKRLMPGHKEGDRIGFGYIFVVGDKFKHYPHDMPNDVKKAGDAFFKEQMLSSGSE